MIKKLIGIIVAVAVVAIIVVAAIRRDGFRSMVLRDEVLDGVVPSTEPVRLVSPAELDGAPAAPVTPVESVDSLASQAVEAADSIR